MRKLVCLVMVLVILLPVVLSAEETRKNEDMSATPQGKVLTPLQHEMGIKVGTRKGMCCPYCGMMGKASMEMGKDGSVVVLIGNKLLKYDAELTLVKEVEIPMPAMTEKQCPMMGKAEGKDSASAAAESQEKTA